MHDFMVLLRKWYIPVHVLSNKVCLSLVLINFKQGDVFVVTQLLWQGTSFSSTSEPLSIEDPYLNYEAFLKKKWNETVIECNTPSFILSLIAKQILTELFWHLSTQNVRICTFSTYNHYFRSGTTSLKTLQK